MVSCKDLIPDILRDSLFIDYPVTDKPALWQHQKKAIKEAANKYALFFDPGCGKTRTAIELYKKACVKHQSALKTIIFAPLNVCRNWSNELSLYLGAKHKVYLVAGQVKETKEKILLDFCKDNPGVGHRFLVINTESLRSDSLVALMIKSKASFIIVDESHMVKTPTSQQTKGLLSLKTKLNPTYLYLLTGTPAPQGEIDLWSTFTLLDVIKETFYLWRLRYFEDKNSHRVRTPGYYPDWRVRAGTKEAFAKLLASCSIVAKKDEVLDLPPLLRTTVYSEMSKEQKKHYETMKEYLFAIDSDGNELNASNVLTRTLRLQQILAGFLDKVEIKENLRLKALDYAISLVGSEQFIIWTIFQPTYGQISSMLNDKGISHGFLTGEQTSAQRSEAMEEFQAGRLKCLIANPRAGGVGVNLTAASYSIHYTKNFNLVDDLQCEARNYRGGSEIHKRITRIDIVTPGTIDEEITEALRGKKSIQDFILGLKR